MFKDRLDDNGEDVVDYKNKGISTVCPTTKGSRGFNKYFKCFNLNIPNTIENEEAMG